MNQFAFVFSKNCSLACTSEFDQNTCDTLKYVKHVFSGHLTYEGVPGGPKSWKPETKSFFLTKKNDWSKKGLGGGAWFDKKNSR